MKYTRIIITCIALVLVHYAFNLNEIQDLTLICTLILIDVYVKNDSK